MPGPISQPRRRLVTIMFSDMVGYSALAQRNETLAVALLNEHRELLRARFVEYGGHEIDAVGDGFFVEFSSAVEAVRCAAAIQQTLTERNAAAGAEREIRVRIGLHVGDVVVQDHRVLGDGVNIAARIQAVAKPGEICLSEDVARQIQNKIDLPVLKLGKGQLKNIRLPVEIYRIVLPWEQRSVLLSERLGFVMRRYGPRRLILAGIGTLVVLAVAGAITWQATRSELPVSDPVLALPRGPSIAVLPFSNLSGDPVQEYFADGLTEEIITQLTRFRELFVIARNSTFRYKTQAVDIKTIARELGVRYVLEGSVRKSPDTIRVTAQLVDTTNGTQLWAETYDRQVTARNMLGVQDEITERIVAKIAEPFGVISRAGVKETQRKRTDNLTAYECVVQARIRRDSPSSPALHLQGRDCLERAVALDPNYADAWAWLAFAYMDEYVFGLNPKPDPLDRALNAARRAVALDPSSAMTHYSLASAHFYRHELDQFAAEAEQALELNPNNALSLGELGNFFGWIGQLDRSMALTKKAMALNPHHPGFFYATVFNYHYHRREYKEALVAAQKWNQPEFFWNQAHLAEAYAQLGRTKEAQAAVAQLLKLYPDFPRKARAEMRIWNITEEMSEHFLDGLRKAGLDIPPETN